MAQQGAAQQQAQAAMVMEWPRGLLVAAGQQPAAPGQVPGNGQQVQVATQQVLPNNPASTFPCTANGV